VKIEPEIQDRLLAFWTEALGFEVVQELKQCGIESSPRPGEEPFGWLWWWAMLEDAECSGFSLGRGEAS
jgi:hypothetical protein